MNDIIAKLSNIRLDIMPPKGRSAIISIPREKCIGQPERPFGVVDTDKINSLFSKINND
jgi:hypothetical protein